MSSSLVFEGKNLVICNYNNSFNSKEELKNFLKIDFQVYTPKIIIFDEYLCPNRCNENDYRSLNLYLKEIYGITLSISLFTTEGNYDFLENIQNIQIKSLQYLGIYSNEKFLHDRYLLILDTKEKKILKFLHLGHSLLEILKFLFSDNSFISRKFSVCDIYDKYIENYLKVLFCESTHNFEEILEKLME